MKEQEKGKEKAKYVHTKYVQKHKTSKLQGLLSLNIWIHKPFSLSLLKKTLREMLPELEYSNNEMEVWTIIAATGQSRSESQ